MLRLSALLLGCLTASVVLAQDAPDLAPPALDESRLDEDPLDQTPLDQARFDELRLLLREDPAAPWRTIPWRIDLLAAQREAAATDRPLFVWAMDGHPLGCT